MGYPHFFFKGVDIMVHTETKELIDLTIGVFFLLFISIMGYIHHITIFILPVLLGVISGIFVRYLTLKHKNIALKMWDKFYIRFISLVFTALAVYELLHISHDKTYVFLISIAGILFIFTLHSFIQTRRNHQD